jgi:hypothetical protein
MRRDEVLGRLRAHEAELRGRGVEALHLFGSLARDSARPSSDVDLFLDHAAGLGLEVIAIREQLRELLAGRADVTTRRSLYPALRRRIEATAVRVS